MFSVRPKQGLRQGTSHMAPVPHTFLFYYGKGENTTFPTMATGNIYPKNNSVQNRAASEFKKKKGKEKKKPLHEFLNPILKHKRNKSIIGCTAPVHRPLPPGSMEETSGSCSARGSAALFNWCPSETQAVRPQQEAPRVQPAPQPLSPLPWDLLSRCKRPAGHPAPLQTAAALNSCQCLGRGPGSLRERLSGCRRRQNLQSHGF